MSCDLAGEAVILSLASETYYGLNDVGALVWSLLQQEPRAVRDLRDALLAEFEVDPATCERDLLVLLNEMAQHGLVHAVTATPDA